MNSVDADVVVIGGSVAGLSAAQMLGRALRRVVVIDAGEPRNRFAAQMHGVLGHDGTPPDELRATGRAELERYGVTVTPATVARVTTEESHVSVELSDGAQITARALILANGARDELPAIDGLAERWGTSVLHCPYCHGWEVRGRRLAVIATSAMSLHQAELVRQWSEHVTLFASAAGDIAPEIRERLTARGVVIVDEPVVAVQGENHGSAEDSDGGHDVDSDGDGGDPGASRSITAVRTADGALHPADAVFVAARVVPRDAAVAGLELVRQDNPMGSFIAVDAAGRTSNPRVWAVGNVVAPQMTVPMTMGAAATVGGAVNMMLVTEDGEHAVAAQKAAAQDPVEFWEQRYAGRTAVWSGTVNESLARVVADLPAGRALDLGSGEGADVLWLAERGWTVTGLELSETAVRRAREAAAERELPPGRVSFVEHDLGGP
ncbi:MAG: FAD-dependent oxidoreductase, partial [Mycetocola sp.]